MEQIDHYTTYGLFKDIIIPLFGSILSFTAILVAIITLNKNFKVARANLQFLINQSHRDIWQKIEDLQLTRIKDPNVDPSTITGIENTNINFVLLNVKQAHAMYKANILQNDMDKRCFMMDVGEFFSLPLPAKVWEENKGFHTAEFHNFIVNSKLIFFNEPLPPKGLKKRLIIIQEFYSKTKTLTRIMSMRLVLYIKLSFFRKFRSFFQKHNNY